MPFFSLISKIQSKNRVLDTYDDEQQILKNYANYTAKQNARSVFQEIPEYPPIYSELPPVAPRYPIYPRKEENKEDLPAYVPSIHKIGVLQRKLESVLYSSPGVPSRRWGWCFVELNNTQLNIYQLNSSTNSYSFNANQNSTASFFPCESSTSPVAEPKNIQDTCIKDQQGKIGTIIESGKSFLKTKFRSDSTSSSLSNNDEVSSLVSSQSSITSIESNTASYQSMSVQLNKYLIHSYTMQNAKFGLAKDYRRRAFVLRLRLEGEQFLFQFVNSSAMIDWFTALSIATDLATPLEEREMPKYRTISRRRRRHRRNHINQNQSLFNYVSSVIDDMPGQEREETGGSCMRSPNTIMSTITSSAKPTMINSAHDSNNTIEGMDSLSQHGTDDNDDSAEEDDHEDNHDQLQEEENDEDEDGLNFGSVSSTLLYNELKSNSKSQSQTFPLPEPIIALPSNMAEEIFSNYEFPPRTISGYTNFNFRQSVSSTSDSSSYSPGSSRYRYLRSFMLSDPDEDPDRKWNPAKTTYSKLRTIRSALRCIPELLDSDPWEGSIITKSVLISKNLIELSTKVPINTAKLKSSGQTSPLNSSTKTKFQNVTSQIRFCQKFFISNQGELIEI